MSRALIPCGTNVPAIATVITHLYERFGANDYVLFATPTSRKHANEAFDKINALVGGKLSSNLVELKEEDMVRDFQGSLGKLMQRGPFDVVDLTGGYKIMPVLAYEAGKQSGAKLVYVLSPAMGAWGWWDDPKRNYYPLVPKAVSRFFVLGTQAPPRPSPLNPPETLEVIKPAECVKDLVFRITRLLNVVSDRVAELHNSAKDKLIAKIELDNTYNVIKLNYDRRAFEDIIKDHTECIVSAYKLRERTIYGLLDSLSKFVGFTEFVIKDTNEDELRKYIGKQFYILVEDVLTNVLARYIFLMDTNLAYNGVHNDIYRALVNLSTKYSRRFDERHAKSHFVFHDISISEVNNKLVRLKVDSVITDYLRLVLCVLRTFEDPDIRIDLPNDVPVGKEASFDDIVSNAKVIYPANEERKKKRNVVVVTNDKKLYETLVGNDVSSMYVETRKLPNNGEDLGWQLRAVAMLVQATYFVAFASREPLKVGMSNALCRPEGLVLNEKIYRASEDCAFPLASLRGDLGELGFCPD